MFIPDSDFISDPTRTIKRRGKLPFFVAINFTKLKTIIFLKRYRKQSAQIDKELKDFFTQTVTGTSKLSEIWG
jgi:hypothetical protein